MAKMDNPEKVVKEGKMAKMEWMRLYKKNLHCVIKYQNKGI